VGKLRIGVRWWVGVTVTIVAAIAAGTVALLVSTRADRALRKSTADVTAGAAFIAAGEVQPDYGRPGLRGALQNAANRHQLSLYLYDRRGRVIARGGPAIGVARREAVRHLLAGDRWVDARSGGTVVVSAPVGGAGVSGLVAVGHSSSAGTALAVVHEETVRAGLVAVLIGALVGLGLAQLIALRLRRLASAAEGIGGGDFEQPLSPRFPDEFSSVASALGQMQQRLRRSFRELRSERDRLRRLLERLEEGVLTVDRELVVNVANREARRLLGRALQERRPLPEPQADLRALARRLFESSAEPEQMRLELPDGRLASASGIPAGDTDLAVIVLADVTERERVELSEREFVTNAAHELRTPLTTIVGAIEVLQSGGKDDPVVRDRFLDHIERESARLGRLTRTLLLLARSQTLAEAPPEEDVPLAPLLERIAASVEPRGDVAVRVECDEGLVLHTNPDLLEQSVYNLAENAAKHTTEGEIVLIGAETDGIVRVEVEDTGPGMSLETQRHVFDRFYRGHGRDPDGFGLGLSIVRQVAGVLGGEVDVDSELGAGTRFAIVLKTSRRQVHA
jgi:two-component system phosphate regulon sensor histidine kinase PhoR